MASTSQKKATGYDKYINWKIFFIPVVLLFAILFMPTPYGMKDVGMEYKVGPRAVVDFITQSLFNTKRENAAQWELVCAQIMEQNMQMGALGRKSFLKRDLKWVHSNQIAADKENFDQAVTFIKEKTSDAVYVHATPDFPESWQYILTPKAAKLCFKSFSQQFCFIGHSHIPAIFMLDSSECINRKSREIYISKGSRYIINCGSVGQPRDNNPLASYGIYDSEKEIYQHNRVEYDIRQTQKKIIEAGLPPYLAKRLELGR